jgi:hypothetical protein
VISLLTLFFNVWHWLWDPQQYSLLTAGIKCLTWNYYAYLNIMLWFLGICQQLLKKKKKIYSHHRQNICIRSLNLCPPYPKVHLRPCKRCSSSSYGSTAQVGPGLPFWGFVTITFLQGWIVSPASNPQPGGSGLRIYDPWRQGGPVIPPGTGNPFLSPFTTCMGYSGTIL